MKRNQQELTNELNSIELELSEIHLKICLSTTIKIKKDNKINNDITLGIIVHILKIQCMKKMRNV